MSVVGFTGRLSLSRARRRAWSRAERRRCAPPAQLNGILARNLNFLSFESGVSVGFIGVTLAKPLVNASMSEVGFSSVDAQLTTKALVEERTAWYVSGAVVMYEATTRPSRSCDSASGTTATPRTGVQPGKFTLIISR